MHFEELPLTHRIRIMRHEYMKRGTINNKWIWWKHNNGKITIKIKKKWAST